MWLRSCGIVSICVCMCCCYMIWSEFWVFVGEFWMCWRMKLLLVCGCGKGVNGCWIWCEVRLVCECICVWFCECFYRWCYVFGVFGNFNLVFCVELIFCFWWFKVGMMLKLLFDFGDGGSGVMLFVFVLRLLFIGLSVLKIVNEVWMGCF